MCQGLGVVSLTEDHVKLFVTANFKNQSLCTLGELKVKEFHCGQNKEAVVQLCLNAKARSKHYKESTQSTIAAPSNAGKLEA